MNVKDFNIILLFLITNLMLVDRSVLNQASDFVNSDEEPVLRDKQSHEHVSDDFAEGFELVRSVFRSKLREQHLTIADLSRMCLRSCARWVQVSPGR